MYKYNHISLQFETDENFLYKYEMFRTYSIILLISLICFVGFSFAANKTSEELISLQKEEIEVLNSKISVLENFQQDSNTKYFYFRKSIPLDLTEKQEIRLKQLYFKHKQLISSYNVPENLLWFIGIKEGNLNPYAKNKESSAEGMFQFIDETWRNMCKRAGLDISGRNNEAKQVRIMCEYLSFLYDKYGDWRKVHSEYCGGKITYKLPYYK